MEHREITKYGLIGVGVLFFVGFSIIIAFNNIPARPRAQNPAQTQINDIPLANNVTPDPPAPLPDPNPANDASIDVHLQAVQTALQKAHASLAKSTAAGKGGKVELARSQVDQAFSDLADLSAYVTSHPDLPAAPANDDRSIPMDHSGGQNNLHEAVTFLNQAFSETQKSPNDNTGLCAKTIDDIYQASETALEAIRLGNGPRANRDPKPAPDPNADPVQLAAQSLAAAKSALAKSSAAGKGGNVELARTQVDAAISDLADLSAYINAHPDLTAAAGDNPRDSRTIDHDSPGGQNNLHNAAASLRSAFDVIQKSPDDHTGLRAKTIDDIYQAAQSTLNAIRLGNRPDNGKPGGENPPGLGNTAGG